MKKPPGSPGGRGNTTELNVAATFSDGWPSMPQFQKSAPWREIDVSRTSAMLRQGRENGWSSEHYQRIADMHAHRYPLAYLVWERWARRVR